MLNVRFESTPTKQLIDDLWFRYGKAKFCSSNRLGADVLMPDFLIKSADPASSLLFSNRSPDYFDVTVETPSLKATKKVSIYDYGPSNGFVNFFQRIASHKKPWVGEEIWEPLEGDMILRATCDALGHVEFKLNLSNGFTANDSWSLECKIFVDFGTLPFHAEGARRFGD
ncbi:hypothetical protein FGG78_13545 [Thioclava sp. BHET1]|nr:hypothetical protein FGG78_13545 [Thioclava sp. BHET1]